MVRGCVLHRTRTFRALKAFLMLIAIFLSFRLIELQQNMQQSLAVADYFTAFDHDRLKNMIVSPPYEKPGMEYGYVRGNVKVYMPNDGPPHGVPKPFYFTGPRLRIVYGQCRWNRVTFSVNDSPEMNEFANWMHGVNERVKQQIYASPDKFKPGAKNANLFSFDDDIIKPSSNPELYPPEIRTKLSSHRQDPGNPESPEIVDATMFMIEDGQHIPIQPSEITSGSYAVPIFKVSYYRNGNRFGTNLTIHKARIWLNDLASNKIENKDLIIDYPGDMEY